MHLCVNTTLPKWENKLSVTTVIPIPLRAHTQGHGYVKQNNEQFPGLDCNQFVILEVMPLFFPIGSAETACFRKFGLAFFMSSV